MGRHAVRQRVHEMSARLGCITEPDQQHQRSTPARRDFPAVFDHSNGESCVHRMH